MILIKQLQIHSGKRNILASEGTFTDTEACLGARVYWLVEVGKWDGKEGERTGKEGESVGVEGVGTWGKSCSETDEKDGGEEGGSDGLSFLVSVSSLFLSVEVVHVAIGNVVLQ